MADTTTRGQDVENARTFNALDVMHSGTAISTYTSSWEGIDFRMFQLNQSNDMIIYSAIGAMGTKGTVFEDKIEVRSIVKIYEGQQTPLFKKYKAPKMAPLCFSIEYMNASNKKEILDLVCCRRVDQVMWTTSLRALRENPSVTDVPIDADTKPSIGALNLMFRTKWKSAARIGLSGTAAVVTFGTPFFLIGAPWLLYSLWTTRQSADKAMNQKMSEIKAYMQDIQKLMQQKALVAHPYYPTAKQRYEYIGKCYESAANIQDYVLESSKKVKFASTIQALAEARALYWKLYILSVQANEKKGWFEGWFGSTDEPVGSTPGLSTENRDAVRDIWQSTHDDAENDDGNFFRPTGTQDIALDMEAMQLEKDASKEL